VTYLELLQAFEQRLGNQHLPLNPRATGMKDLFESMAVHHDLIQRLAQRIYRDNGCRTLADHVHRDACFDAVGAVRQEALKTTSTDVDAYRLLDDLCRILDEIFQVPATPDPIAETRSAEIVPFATKPRHRKP
jgi:hypothetical protein